MIAPTALPTQGPRAGNHGAGQISACGRNAPGSSVASVNVTKCRAIHCWPFNKNMPRGATAGRPTHKFHKSISGFPRASIRAKLVASAGYIYLACRNIREPDPQTLGTTNEAAPIPNRCGITVCLLICRHNCIGGESVER